MFTFFTSQLPELKHLKVRQRQAVVAIALSMLPATDRVLLRIVKLILLSPLFLLFTVFKAWSYVIILLKF